MSSYPTMSSRAYAAWHASVAGRHGEIAIQASRRAVDEALRGNTWAANAYQATAVSSAKSSASYAREALLRIDPAR